MTPYSVQRYSPNDKPAWDAFIPSSKNGTFLFYRDFMNYHKDRFTDHSLLVYKKEKLIALLPAHTKDQTMYSHLGLTYGGLILDKKIKFQEVLKLFTTLLHYLENQELKYLNLKTIPSFYTTVPAEEMDYLCFLLEAETTRVDLATTLEMKNRLPIQKNRLEGVKKAQKNELRIEQTTDFSSFWNEVLIPNLSKTHNAHPVHSLKEIQLLHDRFPENIKQFNVLDSQNKIVAGATIFETQKVAHVQYISGDENKQQLGSLDFLFQHLINVVFKDKPYFDFGTSNENAGRNLNNGLQYWKEAFGARSFVYRSYSINVCNHRLLETALI